MLDKKYDAQEKEKKWLDYWNKIKFMNLKEMKKRCIQLIRLHQL